MPVLIDTAIWIDHLRSANMKLIALLRRDRVITHDHVIGELTMGP